jgi:hypothetical protein
MSCASLLKKIPLILVILGSIFSFPASDTTSGDKVPTKSELVVAQRQSPKKPIAYYEAAVTPVATRVDYHFAIDVKSRLLKLKLTNQQLATSRSSDLQQLIVDHQHLHSLLSC